MSSTIIEAFIARLGQSPLVTCEPKATMNKVFLQFSMTPPSEPGIYAVSCIKREAVFYVGEAGDLKRRLKFLFRCDGGGNPQGLRMNIESIERFAKEGTAAGAKQSLAFDGYLGGF
jgi:hypothetical protein